MPRATLLCLGLWLTLAGTGKSQASDARGMLDIDLLAEIQHPFHPIWSPDGSRVAFVWDKAGAQNVYVIEVSGGQPSTPRALTSYPPGILEDPGGGAASIYWRGNETVLFTREGVLMGVPADGSGDPSPVWESEGGVTTEALSLGIGGSGFAPSPDGTRVAFVRAGDLWIRGVSGGGETRLTDTPSFESGPVFSPDGSRLAFTVTPAVRHDEALAYVGSKILFSRTVGWRSNVAVIPTSGGKVTEVAASPASETSHRWLDDERLCLERLSENQKTREVIAVHVETGNERVLHRDVDEKWWSLTYLGAAPLPSPDGKWVAFLSDKSGWDHIYLVPSEGGEAKPITEGERDVAHVAWSPDGRRIAFSVNSMESPGSRHLAVAEIGIAGDRRESTPLTNGRGTDIAPVWAPDGKWILYQHTDPQNSADIFAVDTGASRTASVRMTDSMPKSIDRSALVEPEFVRYGAPDGNQVPAYLFVPAGLDRSRRHPAIVWIHGDGINQNYDGWHVQRNYAVYYSFHQYLTQQGYVVLAVDYRGSIGYGKRWRQGHFRDLGGADYMDVAAGVDFLKSLGFVNTDRVGVWGLSYGGFLTLQALTVTPELFRCGINVAGVADWRTWYKDPGGPWIHGRMGAPEQNQELYRRTASIEFVDRIERPLMILHGTADVNVPFTESVRLVDVLTKLGIEFDFVMYPGEFHYFHRGHVLKDAWRRVERFFDEHLREE